MEHARAASCPLWAGGNNFSACALDALLPLGLVGTSALLLVAQVARAPTPIRLASDGAGPAPFDASQRVFEAENAVILQEVQSNAVDPVPRPLEQRIISLDLFRSLGQTVGAVVLVGLHVAAWASESSSTHGWQLLWAAMWAYYIGLSYASFASTLAVFTHQCVLQVCYVCAMGANLRALLIVPLSPCSQVLFASLQLAAATLFVLPTLFFPQRLSTPAYLRALNGIDVGSGPAKSDEHEKDPPLAPELTASLYSRIFFGYATPLLWANFWREKASLEEVPNLVPADLTAAALSHFRFSAGRADGKGQHRSLAMRLVLYFWPLLGKQMLYASLRGAVSVAAPLGTEYILHFIKLRRRQEHDPDWSPADGEAPLHVGLLYALLMCVGTLSISVFATQAFAAGRKISVGVRSILISEVMTKALRRSALGGARPTSGSDDGEEDGEETVGDDDEVPTGRATDGQVNNLLSNDAMRVSEEAAYLHFIFPEAPLEVICGIYFLFRLVGWGAVAGLTVLVAMLPVQWYVSTFFLTTEEQLLKVGDRRLNRTLETLQAIRTVKIFAWEKPFSEKLDVIRNMELSILRRRIFIVLIESMSFSATPTFATMAVFASHTYLLHRPLTAEVAFTVLAYLNLVREGLTTLPAQIPEVLSALISLRRIEAFLKEDETSKYEQLLDVNDDAPLVGFTGGAAFTYARNDDQEENPGFLLQGLDLSFPSGLSIVVGPVGSGKSSLLLALLGEMRRVKGQNHLPAPLRRDSLPVASDGLTDTVGYAPQTPWLLGTTIKENILFGLPFDEGRFKAVLKACALEPDLKILEYGEETEVGEKGTALSGGQKARVGLARCLYSSARVLLIDDAFSALDASTSEHMYKHYLRGELARGRTIVTVTHAVSLTMPGAALVVAMEDGKVVVQGPPESVLSSGLFQDEVRELVKEDIAHHHPITIEELEEGERAHEAAGLQKRLAKKAEFKDEEEMAQGAVSGRAYALWMSNFASTPKRSALVWGAVLGLFVAAQSCNIVATAWLKKWAGREDAAPRSEASGQLALGISPHGLETRDDSLRYLAVYALLSLVYVGLNTLKELAALMGSLVVSARIYRQLITAILRAKPSWFDRVPIGRVMNRVAKDISTVDEDLGSTGAFVMDTFLELVAVIAIIAWGSPVLAVFALAMLVAFGVIALLYLHSAQNYKRLESVQRSPLYTLLGDVLSGNILIRACGDMGRFTQQCIRLTDQANRPFHALWLANRWLSTRVSVMSSLITLIVSVVLILTSSVDAAQAGFILSYAILLVDSVVWFVRLYSGFSVNMASVERIDEYLALPSEQAGGTEPPAHWPSEHGGILVNKLSARYSPELPLVLENVSLNIQPGEKIGVCGRTGSGKSSLASCLFRFLEPESGQIIIDGIDIATVPLETLRKRLTVISQQNDIFQGTVRSNLDPFNEYEDLELWNALERCRLVTVDEVAAASRQVSGTSTPAPGAFTPAPGADVEPAASSPSAEESRRVVITGLDMEVLQGGTNFSQGQRQLLALARGVLKLRDSRILILDESTASLDSSSDAKIQLTIRTQMAGATMLVVAHRLRSIADFDRVLLLDKGKIVEFAPPLQLLQDKTSAFHELAVRSGEFDHLLSLATEHSAKSGTSQ